MGHTRAMQVTTEAQLWVCFADDRALQDATGCSSKHTLLLLLRRHALHLNVLLDGRAHGAV